MEQLEFKHVAPYLPYGLKGVSKADNYGIENVIGYQFFGDKCEVITNIDNLYIVEFMPILRNISDLTKEIEHNGERFVPVERIKCLYEIEYRNNNPISMYVDGSWTSKITELPYDLVQLLLEWHFNVFNLPEHLFIDINTLNK